MAIAARPLTMTCWSLAVGRGQVSQAAQDSGAAILLVREIATRAREAFANTL